MLKVVIFLAELDAIIALSLIGFLMIGVVIKAIYESNHKGNNDT